MSSTPQPPSRTAANYISSNTTLNHSESSSARRSDDQSSIDSAPSSDLGSRKVSVRNVVEGLGKLTRLKVDEEQEEGDEMMENTFSTSFHLDNNNNSSMNVLQSQDWFEGGASRQDWANAARIAFVPTALLVLILLIPLSPDSTASSSQNIYLYLLWNVVYHCLTVWWTHNTISLFLPPLSRKTLIFMYLCTLIGTCGYLVALITFSEYEPSIIALLSPWSIVPLILVLLSLILVKAHRMKGYLATLAGDQESVRIQVKRRNYSSYSVSIPRHEFINAPIVIFKWMFLFGLCIIGSWAFAVVFTTVFLQLDSSDDQLFFSIIFPIGLLPFQEGLIFCGKRVDGVNTETMVFLHQLSALPDLDQIMAAKNPDDAHQPIILTSLVGKGIRIRFLGQWIGKLFLSMFFRNLFLSLKNYETFFQIVAFEVISTTILYWVRVLPWVYIHIEKPITDWAKGTCCANICTGEQLEQVVRTLHADENDDVEMQNISNQTPKKLSGRSDTPSDTTWNQETPTINTLEQQEPEMEAESSSTAAARYWKTAKVKVNSVLILNHNSILKRQTREHQVLTLRRYFFWAMAQRFSVISFLVVAAVGRTTWNQPFFGFRDELMTDAEYQQVLEFAAIMLAVEWIFASILWWWSIKRYQLDMIKIGGMSLKSNRFYLCVIAFALHVGMDVLCATNSGSIAPF